MGGGDVHGSHLRMMLGSLWNTFTYYIIYIYIYREREIYIIYIFSKSHCRFRRCPATSMPNDLSTICKILWSW